MESTQFSASAVTIQKILQILSVLKGLPAGSAVYFQVEQLLRQHQRVTESTEQTYASLLHHLLDAAGQQAVGESATTDIRILQARIQPPLLLSDIDTIQEQIENLSLQAGDIPEAVSQLADILSPLLRQQSAPSAPSGYAELSKKQPYLNEKSGNDTTITDMDADASRFYEDVPGIGKVFTDVEEKAETRESLTRELEGSIANSQEVGVGLDLVMDGLQRDLEDDGIEMLRARMLRQIKELQKKHYSLNECLEKSYLYLSNVEIDRRQLDKELTRARLLSLTDELTGLPNRRAFLNRLKDEVGRVQRHKLPLSMAIIDMDGFKLINDTYGHSVGDEVLRCYANEVFPSFREYDLVARYGGEEFAVVLPNTDREGALSAMRKVRMRVEEIKKKYAGDNLPIPSFSAGLALYRDGESISSFIERADQAMYRAKSLGRNRVEMDAA